MTAASRLLVALAAACVLGGCSSVRNRVHDWMGDGTPPPSKGTTRGVTYYAADALPVHATPSDASKVVGRLAPNARVTRTQLDRGWARITGAGVEGWVDATRLLRRPATAPADTSKPQSKIDAPAPAAADDTPTPATAPAESGTAEAAEILPSPPAAPPAPEPVAEQAPPAPAPTPAAPPPPPARRHTPAVEDPF